MPQNIRVTGTKRGRSRFLRVSLTLKFDPSELGAEKTQRLLGGIITAIADVVKPEERAELLRQFESEKKRLRAAG